MHFAMPRRVTTWAPSVLLQHAGSHRPRRIEASAFALPTLWDLVRLGDYAIKLERTKKIGRAFAPLQCDVLFSTGMQSKA